MIGVFKANNPYNYFLLLLYGIVLKFCIFLRPKIVHAQQTDGFLFKAFLGWLHNFDVRFVLIYPLITFTLLFTQAVYFNKLVIDLRLFQKPNYLTGMSYLLVTSLFAEWNTLSAPLIINTILIWVWANMSSLYNSTNPKSSLYNIGIAIGLATFLYFPSLAFAALIIFGLTLIRPFNLTEWLVALLGIITPYYFLVAWVFLTDKWKGYHLPGFVITSPMFNQNKWAFASIIIVALVAAVGFGYIQKNLRRQLIESRKSCTLIFLYFFVALFVPFINATHSFAYWILCAIPISFFLAAAFFYPAKTKVPFFVHLIMIVFAIIIGYFVH